MRDQKISILVIAVLIVCLGVRFGFPEIATVFSTDLIIFFAGGLGLMTIMHYTGYIEGFKEGIEYAETNMHTN